MITTGCEGCCFLKQDERGKGCAIGQMCTAKDGQIFAPGYCRMCRSHKWAKKQGETELQKLYHKVIDERSLKFDMLVFFDESHDNIEDLEFTLNSDWYVEYAQRIIIMDTTGFGERKNLALKYINSRKHPVPILVDSSVSHESRDNREETIRRLSKQIISPFFLVIPAGSQIDNIHWFASTTKHVNSRVIHWLFRASIGRTDIIQNHFNQGLFITAPYRALMRSPEVESFTQQLKKEEIDTGMGLSWFCGNVCLFGRNK